jgi:primosomal protein N' (replication factor Y)
MPDPLFAGPLRGAARVALPVPIDSLFDYAIPEGIDDQALVGCRVVVPFAGRSLTGLIVERPSVDEVGSRDLLEVERMIDSAPVLSATMMDILRETAASVLCPVGTAMVTALPPGSAPRFRNVLELTARGREALRSGALRGKERDRLETFVKGHGNPSAAGEEEFASLVRDRLLSRRRVEEKPGARVATENVVSVAPGLHVEKACQGDLVRAPKQAALLSRLAELGGSAGEVSTRELKEEFPGAIPLLRELSKRGLITTRKREAPRNVLGGPVLRDEPLALTADQQTALKPIFEAIREGRGDRFLLQGVTGSGKTEVYLRAVAEALEHGRQALILVPEITLTHQIVRRLRARFGDSLAILHSGLRPGERLEQWQRLRRGDTPIAVGARSALFAPLERLGIVVVDEEHDSAYKNDEGFRYHATDLARRLAARASCPLVLGSATPSLETRHGADRGALQRLVLPRRVGDRPMPAVQVVDLVAQRGKSPRGRSRFLTQPLRQAITRTLGDGGQTILFLNRRGFSTQILCFDCGHAERCKNCDVALVFHAREHCLLCHYCDYRKPPPDRCEKCGAPDTALLGMGTERLEEETQTSFPEARIARLDRDTARRRGHTEKVLQGLHDGEIDILVGTQMVAKGHDFPGVQLVGVVLADMGLHLPDFRAAERTFQLVTQVAGRAGRAETPGHVVVQTFVPDHYAIEEARKQDYEAFYAREIRERAELSYPPFGRLVQLIISHPEEEDAGTLARKMGSSLEAFLLRESIADIEVLGPAPAPLAKLRGRHRFQLLVKGCEEQLVLRAARLLIKEMSTLPKSAHATLDVNPVNML